MKFLFPSFAPDSLFLPKNETDRDGYLSFCFTTTVTVFVVVSLGLISGILNPSLTAVTLPRGIDLDFFLDFGMALVKVGLIALAFVIVVFGPFLLLSTVIAKPIWFGIFNFFKRRDWGDRKAALLAAWPAVIVANLSFFAMFWLLEALGLQHSLNELGQSLITVSLPLSLIIAPFAAIENFR